MTESLEIIFQHVMAYFNDVLQLKFNNLFFRCHPNYSELVAKELAVEIITIHY